MSEITTDNLTLRDSDGDTFDTRTVVGSSGVHTPVFFVGTGTTDPTLVSSTNGLPVAATISDETQSVELVTRGSQTRLPTHDDLATATLKNICRELRIMNLHLSVLTDNTITDTE